MALSAVSLTEGMPLEMFYEPSKYTLFELSNLCQALLLTVYLLTATVDMIGRVMELANQL